MPESDSSRELQELAAQAARGPAPLARSAAYGAHRDTRAAAWELTPTQIGQQFGFGMAIGFIATNLLLSLFGWMVLKAYLESM